MANVAYSRFLITYCGRCRYCIMATLADFSCYYWNADSKTLAIIHEPRSSNHYWKKEKQILVGLSETAMVLIAQWAKRKIEDGTE